MKRLPLPLALPLLAAAVFASAQSASAQRRAAGGDFAGRWNHAVYAADKSELPPAYRSMELSEVPQFAVDVTITRRGRRLTGTCGILARFLARIEECDFTATVRNGAAQFDLRSSFGGSATVRLTLRRGGGLRWQTLRRRGQSYYPEDVTLRRLKPGETPPYVERESEP